MFNYDLGSYRIIFIYIILLRKVQVNNISAKL